MTKDKALEVPLIELLKAVPKTARLIVDISDGISSTVYPVGHLCHKAAEALEQPAQEPVAWMNDIAYSDEIDNLPANRGEIIPLYSRPHQWVGLTDDEILDLEQKYTDLLVGGGTMFHFEEFAYAIEAKLKDKNSV